MTAKRIGIMQASYINTPALCKSQVSCVQGGPKVVHFIDYRADYICVAYLYIYLISPISAGN